MIYLLKSILITSILFQNNLALAVDTLNLKDYSAICANQMGNVPEFSCLNGEMITAKDGCPELGPDTKCISGSRIGRLPAKDDEVIIVFICRKYHEVPRSIFHDISVIQYHKKQVRLVGFKPL